MRLSFSRGPTRQDFVAAPSGLTGVHRQVAARVMARIWATISRIFSSLSLIKWMSSYRGDSPLFQEHQVHDAGDRRQRLGQIVKGTPDIL